MLAAAKRAAAAAGGPALSTVAGARFGVAPCRRPLCGLVGTSPPPTDNEGDRDGDHRPPPGDHDCRHDRRGSLGRRRQNGQRQQPRHLAPQARPGSERLDSELAGMAPAGGAATSMAANATLIARRAHSLGQPARGCANRDAAPPLRDVRVLELEPLAGHHKRASRNRSVELPRYLAVGLPVGSRITTRALDVAESVEGAMKVGYELLVDRVESGAADLRPDAIGGPHGLVMSTETSVLGSFGTMTSSRARDLVDTGLETMSRRSRAMASAERIGMGRSRPRGVAPIRRRSPREAAGAAKKSRRRIVAPATPSTDPRRNLATRRALGCPYSNSLGPRTPLWEFYEPHGITNALIAIWMNHGDRRLLDYGTKAAVPGARIREGGPGWSAQLGYSGERCEGAQLVL